VRVTSRVDLLARLGPRPALIGMVHLEPLPGAPRWAGSMGRVVERAVADARLLREGGIAGLLVENYGDAPFHAGAVPPETVAAMAVCVAAVRAAVDLPVGVNVLRNDAAAALSVAAAAGASFVRVNVHTGAMLTDQGWIEGRAAGTLRLRARLDVDAAILADVLVKHATAPLGTDPGQAARDAWHRGLADGLIVSGAATAGAVDPERLRAVREAVPGAPLLIGSGLTPANAAALLPLADGAIVGSAVRREGRAGQPVDSDRLRALLDAVRALR
jgi:membrane complex biogenesis BtpA family protein